MKFVKRLVRDLRIRRYLLCLGQHATSVCGDELDRVLEVVMGLSETISRPVTEFAENRMVRDGWGTRSNFQASYGLSVMPEGYDDGKAILKAFEDLDRRMGEGTEAAELNARNN
ncbi:hypothetical protein MRB53_038485 [Persea americana]|nr:hypothetical protein MRB53_038485 [Persea americana]